ncbi:MAG: hypothetical protein OSB25_10330 [Salibacteraceae bacterium]|nr:hypothetical protein [Salibacteraceae bacterium]|tara:strand:+ start:10085 stop:10321 length:237 start_codon:yes stop_codon:yes gene_type:complete
MTTNKIEKIGEKVDRLITAYRSSVKELEALRAENSKLRNTINNSSESSMDNSFENEQIKKKVDALISELDKCVQLISK